MKPQTDVLFSSDLWMRALDKYASDTHLSVKLFAADERVVFGPINSTPLFKLFDEKGYDPGIFAECARQCLIQTDSRPAVMVSEVYGLAVVGTSLVLNGAVVGAAVGGYAFTDFSQLSEVQRLAKDAGIKFDQLWEVAREQKPVPKQRLMLNGELLQVLGDALLRENYRTRQYEDAVQKLEEAARAKEQAHRELEQTASALNRELMATCELQSASATLFEGGDEPALYQKIVAAAATIMRSELASMQMLYPERGSGGELRLLGQRGFDPQATAFWEWVRADSACSCGAALKSRTRVVVPDVEKCDFMAGTEDLLAYLRAGIHAVQSTPLLSRGGNLLGMISTHWRMPHMPEESDLLRFDVLARQAADLLERKQAEQALRKSEEQFRAVFEQTTGGIAQTDLTGHFVLVNDRYCEIVGRSREQLMNLHMQDITHPEDLPANAETFSALAGGQGPNFVVEIRYLRPDGSHAWVRNQVSAIRDIPGRVISLVAAVTDITDRKQAEEALRRAAEFDEAVMINMGEGLYTVDSQGRVTSINPVAERLFGWTLEEIQGRKMHALTHHHHPDGSVFPAEECPGLQVLKQGKPLISHEDAFIRRDGSFFPVVFSSAPLRSAGGEIIGLVVVFRDISERKQAEAAAREQEERLLKVEKMAAAGQLAAAMAHEINNPLSSVTNALYLLQKHANLDESARFFVTTAAAELARVSRIVKQSLSYYRVGTTPQDLDLGEVVNESLQIFSERIEKADVELKSKVRTGTILLGFPDELRQVIDNLLLNALEAMPRGGRLSISVHSSSDWTDDHNGNNPRSGVRVTVADTGCGIPKENRWRIFEPFFTTKAEKGTGLGLWILQGIIAKHEGILNVRSSDAESRSGTAVSIFLPSHSRLLRTSKPSEVESAA